MTKVVINKCFGGFGLSEAAYRRYAEIKGLTLYVENGLYNIKHYYTVPPEKRPKKLADPWISHSLETRTAYNEAEAAVSLYAQDIPRNDPALVQTVEELGSKASSNFADLAVVEIPDDVEWGIHEYDGLEHVEEIHRTWS